MFYIDLAFRMKGHSRFRWRFFVQLKQYKSLGPLSVAAVTLLATSTQTAMAQYSAPVTANPSAQSIATIPTLAAGQSWTSDGLGPNGGALRLRFADNDLTADAPTIYWFKYTADGDPNVRLTFDTYGSDFSSTGPGAPSGGGFVLPNIGETQIAVYKADGTKVAISRRAAGADGNPLEGTHLSEVHFEQNAPSNPRWSVQQSDLPLGYTAPGGQYYANLNEYAVWDQALDKSSGQPYKVGYKKDVNGNPVNSSGAVIDTSQPGWESQRVLHTSSRFFLNSNHYLLGPAASWSRFETLEAGEYYIAISSVAKTFAGDTYYEEYLRAQIHGIGNNESVLSQPLGTFQYYDRELTGAGAATPYWGNIALNVTATLIPEPTLAAPLLAAGLLLGRRRNRHGHPPGIQAGRSYEK